MENQLVKFDHLGGRITQMLAPIKGIVVRDLSENAAAKGALVTVKALGKEIDALKGAVLAPHKLVVEQVNARVKNLLAPLEEAEAEIKRAMTSFAAAEYARIQKEKQEAEAKAALEHERIYQERLAKERKEKEERERLVAEERARAAEAERARKAEAAFGVEDPEAIAQRAAAEKKAAEERAEKERQLTEKRRQEELQSRREAEAVEERRKMEEKRIAASAPKGTTTVWKFEITDRLDVPMEYWQLDEVAIGKAVRGGLREITGVRIWSEQVVVAR